jgi:predicted metal-dependent hydrolase
VIQIDQIIRSDRRTVAIIVHGDGRVTVRAPRRATQAEIERFVLEKQSWIEAKLEEVRRRASQRPARAFTGGESLPYLGRLYPLEIVPQARPALRFTGDRFLLAQSAQTRARETFTAWYRARAREVIEERARLLASRFGLRYETLRITSARTRWGSCSSRGTISFAWRLVMAPLPVIDYVVIHELAHLVERNHSSRFWARVSSMLPDYKENVAWLKKNGHLLTLS